MKKEFKIGMSLKSNTEYYATEKEYHVYHKDAFTACDDHLMLISPYVAAMQMTSFSRAIKTLMTRL